MKNTVIRIVFLIVFIALIVKGKMMLWLALFGASLLVTAIFGRLYCGYACPINTIIQPVERISRKMKWQRSKYPRKINANILGGIMVFISIASIVFTKRVVGQNIPLMPIWIGIAVLLTIRYKQTFFHNYICPFGWIQKIFARFSIYSKRVKTDQCIGCSLCEPDCPTDAIVVNKSNQTANINKQLCFQCDSCQSKCPKSIISY